MSIEIYKQEEEEEEEKEKKEKKEKHEPEEHVCKYMNMSSTTTAFCNTLLLKTNSNDNYKLTFALLHFHLLYINFIEKSSSFFLRKGTTCVNKYCINDAVKQ